VVQINEGLAVVAASTWAAIKGREALQIEWDEGENADLSSGSIRESLTQALPQPEGDAQNDPTRLSAAYDIPFLAHATMEPMNCTADVRAESCEVWAPTQDPQRAKQRVVRITQLPTEAVTLHVTLIGGGFGRRLQVDYVEQAVRLSQAIGAPVQVLFTREDDVQHDFYHPLSYNTVDARWDAEKRLVGMPRVRSLPVLTGVPTGAWRSVQNFTDAFARECFLDEVAAATDRDPVELRLDLLPTRAGAVVELAATRAQWGSALPEGWGRGIAYYATFDVTHVAQVVELSVAADGTVRVQRVVCAVDCGTVINPDTVVAQMEGGIAFGLTAALKAAVTVENGRAQQSNFHDYPLLRMDEMPPVEVYIVPSDARPTGIGEMGVPPIAPAVANAVYAATGKRVRRLPIRAEDLAP
jgi:isoquinoline 1-oxidoreductase beta subunit